MFPIFLTTGSDATFGIIGTILPFALVLVVMYFLMIRPQKKKDKQLQDLRNALEIGDNVTTIGGIVGRVVALKDDTIVLETGTERNKVRFKRWAVQDVEKLVVE
ncbi:preprotein translocase subunit YajC [Anaerofilum sp. BX8]|uniref:Preprotein translocase subunit YajC n=1 Tax=Anaerofilum hominis TaxID=2763016 RepID=A0A923I6B8_9FIRM|nr:preprotein translocase subunit YajC [Anaerofilum hominis]MBC5579959.1 preprotein translocase subunit YajC [Anaerofilum hominis]